MNTTILHPDAQWRKLHEAATAPYRKAGRFAWHFARGKLSRDPVFRGLIERGLIAPSHARVLDIGCGQGIFASLLSAMSSMQAGNDWPGSWSPTPAKARYTGIELMARDVERAARSVGDLPTAPSFVCADMCSAEFTSCDLVVILDVLHYVDLQAQERVLLRVRDALARGQAERGDPTPGRLLLRVGDAANRRGYLISQWVDRTVTRVRGHRVAPTWGRPLAEWVAMLDRLGFAVQSVPMSRGTPFANVLLVADLKQDA
ncbi:class I SAM-dependent methyltransferase [Variovorax sp. J22R133]|uniref:class I SAM-dependent methyltransferase n=1 Tax=Variovorax brevis TaxID=3053503 RepID=UPI00257870F8|nr:class I SAM-dependent methyltransferase [Variovorax sp. J22R133]MDM0112394.1 class I SAM-dependent methyltransferase [Variovorax sp. J22R133]